MANFSIFSIFVFLLYWTSAGECANILFYHNLASYSHRVPTYELGIGLAKRGHQVSMISPFKPREPIERHPNFTDITPASVEKYMAEWLDSDFDISHRMNMTFERLVFTCFPTAVTTCELLLRSPELKEYFEKTQKLDLVIMDNCMAECGAAIAHKYGAKHIYFNTVTYMAHEYDFYGMHSPESGTIPELEIFPPQVPMTFLEKVFNVLISLHFRYEHYKYMQNLDAVVRKNLNMSGMPFMDDLARNHSLVFHTGDVVTDFPRSQPPNSVNVAGIHCKNISGTISKEVEKFINEGDSDGFVYVSLGSFVVPSRLPEEIKGALLNTTRSFPRIKFLWKWDPDFPKLVPENVYIAKWFPQQEVLAHPRIKGFVTQGGRPSTLEAVCHGVPMVAFPVLGDQDMNTNRMEKIGGAIKLELGTVTEEQFTNALNEVVYGGRMMTRAKQLQRVFLDRPKTPLEDGIWWTEYVLRNDDMGHLRPAGFHQTWYERRILDVYAFLFCVILIVGSIFLALSFAIVKFIIRPVTSDNKSKKD